MAKKDKLEAIENEVLQVGNSTMNTVSLAGMTEKEFVEAHKGKLTIDMKVALKMVKKYLKK